MIVFDGANNSISANTVAFNDLHGVAIIADSSKGNPITGNSLFSNGLLGMDLRGGTENAADATANDPGDTDAGPNGLQNKPVITAAKTVSGKTTIKGTLNSASNKVFNVQLFSNPSGNEGKRFVGQREVKTDGSGNATFTLSPAQAVGAGQTITATATLSALGGSTSEFSAPRTVAAS